jgi:hypothetical protein
MTDRQIIILLDSYSGMVERDKNAVLRWRFDLADLPLQKSEASFIREQKHSAIAWFDERLYRAPSQSGRRSKWIIPET